MFPGPILTVRALCHWLLAIALTLTVFSAWSSSATAQTERKAGTTAKEATPKDKPPPPEEEPIPTKDGVVLKATFYPGTKGKESVPIILLHMYKGSRKDYAKLALFLQKQGHAVLVPDLRGHGDSTQVQGSSRPLEVKTMRPQAFVAMVTADMEACKKFLMAKNNDGELNIEKLCLVGAEMGAVVAMDWARADWNWPPLVTGKQGQDVKAVVLLSPRWSFRTLRMKPILAQPRVLRQLSTMILVGAEDRSSLGEAKRLYAALKRSHPSAEAEKPADRTLIYLPLPTSLKGTKMLDAPALKVPQRIARFVEVRLVDQDFPWKNRDTLP